MSVRTWGLPRDRERKALFKWSVAIRDSQPDGQVVLEAVVFVDHIAQWTQIGFRFSDITLETAFRWPFILRIEQYFGRIVLSRCSRRLASQNFESLAWDLVLFIERSRVAVDRALIVESDEVKYFTLDLRRIERKKDATDAAGITCVVFGWTDWWPWHRHGSVFRSCRGPGWTGLGRRWYCVGALGPTGKVGASRNYKTWQPLKSLCCN